jgi:glucose-specific phosphotransferase system IIA component
MGLFDKFRKSSAEKDTETAPSAPASIQAQWESGVVCAPVTGTAVALGNVGDPVFSGGMLGQGCGVKPDAGTLFSPAAGTVTATTPTNHAIGITSDGVEILLHIGIDTVEMKGEGFCRFVADGDEVVAGQPLLTFDRAAIEAAGHDDVVICVVPNSADMASVDMVPAEGSTVQAGTPVLKVQKK